MFLKGTGSQLAASFFTMQLEKLLVNEKKTTASCHTNMSPKHCIKHYKPQKWTLKNCFDSIFFKFVHACLFLYLAVLFITSFNFLSSYFYVSFNLNFYQILWHCSYLWGNCSLQGWKTINFIQYFGRAVLFEGSLLLLPCGNDWRVRGVGGKSAIQQIML